MNFTENLNKMEKVYIYFFLTSNEDVPLKLNAISRKLYLEFGEFLHGRLLNLQLVSTAF